MRYTSLSVILVRKEYLAKINNLPSHHGAGPLEARDPMQPHRLHRLKAGPAYWLISPYKIYLETGHLIENFVNDWYLTTNTAGFTKRLCRLKPRASRSKGGLQQTVVRIESIADIWSFRETFVKILRWIKCFCVRTKNDTFSVCHFVLFFYFAVKLEGTARY